MTTIRKITIPRDTPAQAEHSPGQPDYIAAIDLYEREMAEISAERDEARAHAQRLADECGKLIKAYQWDAKSFGFSCRCDVIFEAREAIAQWEGAAQ